MTVLARPLRKGSASLLCVERPGEPHHKEKPDMTQPAHWILRHDRATQLYVIELSCGADRIQIPNGHPIYDDARRQIQLLISASGLAYEDRTAP